MRGTRQLAVATHHNLTRYHYFIVANIQGKVYVVDAMTELISDNLHQYYQQNHFHRLHYATEYETSEAMEL